MKGFDFEKLVQRKPQAKEELLMFRDQLLSMDDGERFQWSMDVSRMRLGSAAFRMHG